MGRTTKTAAEVYKERLEAFGFKQIAVWVPENEAALYQAETALKAARAIREALDNIRITQEGIEDERFDVLMDNLDLRGVPRRSTILERLECAVEKDERAMLEEAKALSYELSTLTMQVNRAERRYEEAASTEKYDAGLEWRLSLARRYATGRYLRALYKYANAKYGEREALLDDTD